MTSKRLPGGGEAEGPSGPRAAPRLPSPQQGAGSLKGEVPGSQAEPPGKSELTFAPDSHLPSPPKRTPRCGCYGPFTSMHTQPLNIPASLRPNKTHLKSDLESENYQTYGDSDVCNVNLHTKHTVNQRATQEPLLSPVSLVLSGTRRSRNRHIRESYSGSPVTLGLREGLGQILVIFGQKVFTTQRCACKRAKSLQLCPILCDPLDCPSFSVHGVLQARILERVAMPSSRQSS